MLISTLLVGLCSVVILVGAAAELVEAIRLRGTEAGGAVVARTRVLADLDVRPFLVWLGVAAAAVLGAALLARRDGDVAESALVIGVVGFAAERGAYLVRRASTADRRSLGVAAIAVGTVAVGVLLGLGV